MYLYYSHKKMGCFRQIEYILECIVQIFAHWTTWFSSITERLRWFRYDRSPFCMLTSPIFVCSLTMCNLWLRWSCCFQRKTTTWSRQWSVRLRVLTFVTVMIGTNFWVVWFSGWKCQSNVPHQFPWLPPTGFTQAIKLQFRTWHNLDLIKS